MRRNPLLATIFTALGTAALVYASLSKRGRLRRDQVALITGGSSGLGLALAHRFAAAGLKIVLAARDREQLQSARAEILSRNPSMHEDDILLLACDVSDKVQAADLIRSTLQAFGALDVLINNAGIIEVGPALDQPLEAYERAMAVDFFGALYTTYAALPYMVERRAGAIVNISSIGGKVAVPHLLPYVAAKFALTGFSEGLHAELRHTGIRVTTVCPGLMRTGGEAHAHFAGRVDKEKAWFQTSARTPLLSANVHRAADKIFDAVNDGRAEITITPQAWLTARIVGLAPETSMIVAALVNEYLLPDPTGESKLAFDRWLADERSRARS
jgi:short-subunit dehydrogenase